MPSRKISTGPSPPSALDGDDQARSRTAASDSGDCMAETSRARPDGAGVPPDLFKALSPAKIISWRVGGSTWRARMTSVIAQALAARSGGGEPRSADRAG